MKRILNIVQEYLRKYPSPSQITAYPSLFKLNYVYSSPFTDSKLSKEVYYPYQCIQNKETFQMQTKKIIYNQKGRIEESDSFDSILTKEKHQKLFQDDIFGKANHNKDYSRWVYIAEVKQEPVKSYFNDGKGKLPYKHDFGQTYDEIREVGIFVWDKNNKKVFRVEIDKQLIPSCPSFSNDEGSQIIFHAYQRENFGHGILHCFDMPVNVYRATIEIVRKQSDKKQEGQKPKAQQIKLDSKVDKIITDEHKTNIFPKISPCFNYLVYLSGSGITHTYYLDFVVNKKIDGKWVQTHRIKEHFVGYYNTLKNYIYKEAQSTFAITQTIEGSCAQIYKINLQTGQYLNLTQHFKDHQFSIQEVSESGFITGTVTTNNFNTFFYINNNQITIIDPPNKQNFTQRQYHTPIHAIYIEAKEQDIFQQFRQRIKKRPLLVLPHGGPHGSFAQALTAMRFVLLKMGYGLLLPNFSGSAGYGKALLEGALTTIGETDARQILKIMQAVFKDYPNIDQSNVHIQGASYGGYMAALMGSRYPKHFKSAIVMNGVLNIIANLWFTDIPRWNTVQALKRHQLAQLDKIHYEKMWQQSPASDTMKIPTLQFLGAKDRRVPYKQGLFFDAITRDVGTSITTYVYENSAHSLSDSVQTSIDILIKSILFLQGIKQENATQKSSVSISKKQESIS